MSDRKLSWCLLPPDTPVLQIHDAFSLQYVGRLLQDVLHAALCTACQKTTAPQFDDDPSFVVASDQLTLSCACLGGLSSPLALGQTEDQGGLVVAQEWLRGDEQSSLLMNDCAVALVDQAHLQRMSREFLLSRSYWPFKPRAR